MMCALYILWYMSGRSDIEIKPIALAIIKLHLPEDISQVGS